MPVRPNKETAGLKSVPFTHCVMQFDLLASDTLLYLARAETRAFPPHHQPTPRAALYGCRMIRLHNQRFIRAVAPVLQCVRQILSHLKTLCQYLSTDICLWFPSISPPIDMPLLIPCCYLLSPCLCLLRLRLRRKALPNPCLPYCYLMLTC